jgi:trehalose 6-phosphate phosphatase
MTTQGAPDVARALRAAGKRALLALDFDGTLAPIVSHPDDARLAPGAHDALRTVAARGATVGVITGRDAQTAVRLGELADVPGLVVDGLYGAESWSAGELRTRPTPAAISALRIQLPKTLAAGEVDPAVWIEDKRLSLVVHTRGADDPEAALAALRAPLEALAAQLSVELHPGRDVFELRLPGYDKGATLRRLVAEHRPAAVFYAGDDVGDLPAFAQIRRLRAAGLVAWSAAVLSDEAQLGDAADIALDGPDALVGLLRVIGSGDADCSGQSGSASN